MAIKKVKLPDNTTVELNDARVDVSSPSNGQVLAYNSTSQKFENQSISTGGGDVYFGDSAGSGNAAEILSGVTFNGTPATVTNGVAAITATIPTVNNSTITIQKNGTTVDSFTTNASSGKSINITVSEPPSVSSSDNGKVLEVSNGAWAAVKPVTIYSGSSAPSPGTGSNGDIYIQTES